MAATANNDVFAARLARINKNCGAAPVLLTGVGDIPTQRKMVGGAKRATRVSIKAVLGFPFAFGVGALAMLAGHAASYRYLDHAALAADALGLTKLVAADIALAVVLSLIILLLSGFARKAYVMSAALGFAAIITQEIELARAFPEIWAQIYSPHFVERSLQAGRLLLPEIATSFSLT